ncbi:glycosyltransferase [Mollicutes bacterium LVI A0078]|nr:glycosyltransferase [Mollicutes bacterium LVI A0075]WOO91009.1 glycosyltransferase [Mollicutes bacterium LVI A0078]
MVFITYGTQPHDFKFMGELANSISQDYQVVAQIGESKNNITRPNTKVFDYTTEFDSYIDDCQILITHGGVGSIMGGLMKGKKVIAISRLAKFGEHVDDHQLEVTTKLAKDNYIYHMQRDEDINQVIKKVLNLEFDAYESNTINFVHNIEQILLGEK